MSGDRSTRESTTKRPVNAEPAAVSDRPRVHEQPRRHLHADFNRHAVDSLMHAVQASSATTNTQPNVQSLLLRFLSLAPLLRLSLSRLRRAFPPFLSLVARNLIQNDSQNKLCNGATPCSTPARGCRHADVFSAIGRQAGRGRREARSQAHDRHRIKHQSRPQRQTDSKQQGQSRERKKWSANDWCSDDVLEASPIRSECSTNDYAFNCISSMLAVAM